MSAIPRFARDLASGLAMVLPSGFGVAISAHWWQFTGDQWWVYAPAYVGVAASAVLLVVMALRMLTAVARGGDDA